MRRLLLGTLLASVFVLAQVLGCSSNTPGEGGLPEVDNTSNQCLDGHNASEGSCNDAGVDAADGDDGSAATDAATD